MVRAISTVLLLLAAGLAGCSKSEDAHSESIPDIPPGRGSVGPEQGQQMPVAPPKR